MALARERRAIRALRQIGEHGADELESEKLLRK